MVCIILIEGDGLIYGDQSQAKRQLLSPILKPTKGI